MTIESCFPQNPTQTTIENAASTGTHIFFPWSNHPVQLGAGFKSKKARDGDPFEVPCAFANWSRDSIPVTYINDDGLRGSELSTSSSNSAFSSEHLSVSLGVSAGCKFLGGSVAGAYDTAIENNTDASKSSIKASVRLGTVAFTEEPSLSSPAIDLLSFTNPVSKELALDRFYNTYGDYYVAGLRLGGDTCAFASIDRRSQLESESLNVTVEARVLFWSASKIWKNYTSSQSAHISAQFAGYDSLKEKAQVIGPGGSFDEVNKLGMEYQTAGQHLTQRAADLARGFGFQYDVLEYEREVTMTELEQICRSGLVVEVILQPYTMHRGFSARVHRRSTE